MKNRISGFSIVELLIVFFISCLLIILVQGTKKIIKMSRLASAINLTAQVDFVDDDGLVLWLETSNMTKGNNSNSISVWTDLSKNKNEFTTSSGTLEFTESKIYKGINAVKFDGSNYFQSSIPLNLNKYTAFLVANPDSGVSSSINIFDSGFVATVQELSSRKIIVLKNTGSSKYVKSVQDTSFTLLSSSSSELDSSPTKFYVGNDGYKGEILEIIVFNRILEDLERKKVEEYLANKYMR